MEMICFILYQHTELDFNTARSLKHLSKVKHFAPLRHIIQTPSQSVLALTPSCYVLSGEEIYTFCINWIVFCLARPGLEATIYRARGEHANNIPVPRMRSEPKRNHERKICAFVVRLQQLKISVFSSTYKNKSMSEYV